MKIFSIRIFCFISIATACAATSAQTAGLALTTGDKKLTLQMHTKCSSPRPSRKELAKYLAQYDPRQEEGLTTYDEDRPFSKEDVKLIRDGLVEDGFHYPNGEESVITWMDFDGDGICDFTASAGIGGMKSIDRMFLFRGMPNGNFQLVDSFHTYMEGNSILVPYIPIKVYGEKLPVLAKGKILMQWQNDRKQFATCETLSNATSRKKKSSEKSKTLLATLCPHAQGIATWAENQLPQKNEIPY